MAYSRRIVRETRGEVSPPVLVKVQAEEATAESAPIEVGNEAPRSRPAAPVRPRRAKVTPELDDEETYAFEEPATAKGGVRKPRREASRPRLAEETAAPKWVSGVEGVEEDYDDEAPGPRKRTKAERKQLRREKERRAA